MLWSIAAEWRESAGVSGGSVPSAVGSGGISLNFFGFTEATESDGGTALFRGIAFTVQSRHSQRTV